MPLRHRLRQFGRGVKYYKTSCHQNLFMMSYHPGPFYWHSLTWIPTWISNHTLSVGLYSLSIHKRQRLHRRSLGIGNSDIIRSAIVGVSVDCLVNRLFRGKSKKTSTLQCHWYLWREFTPLKGPVTRIMFPFDDVIMPCGDKNQSLLMKGVTDLAKSRCPGYILWVVLPPLKTRCLGTIAGEAADKLRSDTLILTHNSAA